MTTGLHTLKRTGARTYKRVGRGQSSGRGKTSGRGTKGQSARAGNKKRPELRDIIKKVPKRRGYGKNRGRTVVSRPRPVVVPLSRLSIIEAGSVVTPQMLADMGVVKLRSKQLPLIKIVGGSALEKKLSFKGLSMTASARVAVEKAGGTIA